MDPAELLRIKAADELRKQKNLHSAKVYAQKRRYQEISEEEELFELEINHR